MKTMTNRIINAKTKDLKYTNQAVQESLNGQPVFVKNADHLNGLAAGLKHGEVVVQGNAGDYLGVLNDGAVIHVTGNVGNYLADNMTHGTVIVDGDAQYGPGQYCYNGAIVIRGKAGDFTATMNKGATIIIGGDVGDEVGTYMLKGDLIVVGNAGKNFANYLIRGSVYIGGTWESLGHNTRLEPLTDEDVAKLRVYFETYQIEAEAKNFKKIVAASEKPFYH
jgi:methylamine---glutamate N-methyltransferase subunit B